MSNENSALVLSPWPAPAGGRRAYHAMIKPIRAICNLDCTYCYYLPKKDLLGSNQKFRISDEILETHIRQHMEGQDRSEVVFSWQGGEPTLLGIEFFEKAAALEQNYKKPNQRIENDMQTDGTLLNECPKNRMIRTRDGEPGLNYLCSGLQKY